ncbi:Predicted metal-dependent phosphohydrolase, HD superfamily [Amycolatopsis tolypomycina]|uniref:Predicted metal-dependent phosphohydrolase, HD superfamily n=1 Tax=Amycolatopsis tolypomycina TaxID=208445 RepID=A0A1H4RI16_9PSEU|nr:HD domain-containing protein [Amycolatopsis tolypomycina]SEC31515.1 Predicted metal-dependent phosphohydrolase, HD superfamily [Amycolatopsis tolypomycina]
MRWPDAIGKLGGTSDAWPRLEARYTEPHRRYHTLDHAAAVARDSAWLAEGLGDTDRAIVAVAAWTHDVVYDAKPGEDERASAKWAREALEGVAEAHVERVESLILATIGHDAPPDDLLATALLDADLAILGAAEEQYAAYARAVREEYAKYPDDVWRQGRIAVLEGMLARELYRSEAARTRWASAAERNLTTELTHWRGERTDHR